MEKTPIAPAIPTTGEQIRQIYYELIGVSKFCNSVEKGEILKKYQEKLEMLGGSVLKTRRITTKGKTTVTEHTYRHVLGAILPLEERQNYIVTVDLWRSLDNAQRRWSAFRPIQIGAKDSFKDYFDVASDEIIKGILSGVYKPHYNRLLWKKSRASAAQFCNAAGLSESYFNSVFVFEDSKKLVMQDLPKDRRKTDRKRKMPDIVKRVARYVAGKQFSILIDWAESQGFDTAQLYSLSD